MIVNILHIKWNIKMSQTTNRTARCALCYAASASLSPTDKTEKLHMPAQSEKKKLILHNRFRKYLCYEV